MTAVVDLRAALHLVAVVVQGIGAAFLVPLIVAVIYDEPIGLWLALIGGTVALGTLLRWATYGSRGMSMREGFFVVGVSWLAIAVIGALPYVALDILGPIDAFFESMSGFTTTGATVLPNIEGQTRSLLIWRSLTQWVGGLGIIVLVIAILPRLGIGGRQLMEAEAPGPQVERLFPHMRQTARTLWQVYLGLSLGEVILLAIAGISLYEALAHTFTTISTGGFGTRARSIEPFPAAAQWIIVVFIILGGSSFALLYRGLRSRLRLPRVLWADREFRFYILAFAAFALLLTLSVQSLYPDWEATLRHGVFQAASIMTTTGYANADFNEWSNAAQLLLLVLMFVGGCAGSTSGSIKIIRTLLILKLVGREIRRIMHPQAVIPLRLGDRVISEEALRGVLVFSILYVTIFAVSCIVLMLDAERAGLATGEPLPVLDAISAVAASIGNVGPGFGIVGPMNSYAPLPGTSKLLLAMLMWLGRLELFPIIVMLTKSYWRGS